MADSPSEASETTHSAPFELRAHSRVGTILHDKWKLDVLLGIGGMASVYAATDRSGTRAAIKILHEELAVVSSVRSRFMREGRVANRIPHDGVVKVADGEVADDCVFLVMELLDGESLQSRARRLGGKLSIDEVLCATDQILDVLIAAHRAGIIHRDLKPDNVFLTRDGQVKLLDFGIARLKELSTASSATHTGASLGTPAYMPPEQARGLWDEVDGRSDLWAVGALMLSLATGRHVHAGRTANEVLLAAMTQPAPPIRTIDPTIPDGAAGVIDRALRFERDERWPDAEAMQEALRVAYQDLHRAPLSEAPKLVVPRNVVDRTLALEPERAPEAPVAAAVPDVTAEPVAGGVRAADRSGRQVQRQSRLRLAWATVIMLALLVVTGSAMLLARGRKSELTSSPSAAAPAALDSPREVTTVRPELPADVPVPTPIASENASAGVPSALSSASTKAPASAVTRGGKTLPRNWKDQRR